MRTIALAMLLLLPTASSADKTKRLSAAEKDHYQALKVYMTKGQRKAFLKVKTEEGRNAALKKAGLWDKFYQYNDALREDILKGDVKVGWDENAVFMSWGAPVKKLSITGRDAELADELQYRFEVAPDGYVAVWTEKSKTEHKAAVLYQIQLTVDDGKVARMVRTDCIPNWNFCSTQKWQKGK